MPQMAPLNWSLLYLLFITIFLIMNFMNYFSYMKTPKKTDQKTTKKIINWKW